MSLVFGGPWLHTKTLHAKTQSRSQKIPFWLLCSLDTAMSHEKEKPLVPILQHGEHILYPALKHRQGRDLLPFSAVIRLLHNCWFVGYKRVFNWLKHGRSLLAAVSARSGTLPFKRSSIPFAQVISDGWQENTRCQPRIMDLELPSAGAGTRSRAKWWRDVGRTWAKHGTPRNTGRSA